MTPRLIILLAVAVIAGFLWMNLVLFGVLDQTIDRVATARMAGKFTMQAKGRRYQCYPDRRVK